MKYETVADVYAANDKRREELIEIISDLDEEQINFRTVADRWTIQEIVEHLAKVETSMIRISSKLLSKAEAEDKNFDGRMQLSDEFTKQIENLGDAKFQAPESVEPAGTQAIPESFLQMKKSREILNEMRSRFESFDGSRFTFPHPAFGQMSAYDWLALIGLHELRHTNQIKGILSTLR